MKEKILLVIFPTLFSKIGPKQGFLTILSHFLQNSHSIWFPHKFSILAPKVTPKGLQIVKNHYFGPILLNKVGKITNKIFSFIFQKMLTAYGFHIDFQFWHQKSLPRDLQMVQTPVGQFLRPSPVWFQNFQNFLFPQGFLCISAAVRECQS